VSDRRTWWPGLLALALGVGCWVALVEGIGSVHERQCIQDGLDAGRSSFGAELVPACQGPTVTSPLRGTDVGWPPAWEVGWLVVGTLLIVAAVSAAALTSARRTHTPAVG
jgi:hypothetical protein